MDLFNSSYTDAVPLFTELNQYLKTCSESVEGNLCFPSAMNINPEKDLQISQRENKTTIAQIQSLHKKQENIINLTRDKKNILEIGMNAGHSGLLMLANSSATITFIDICYHKYTKPCFQLLATNYPGRCSIVVGDSNVTVPKIKDTYDFIHIDGGHLVKQAWADLVNCHKLLKENGVILFDDTQKLVLNDIVTKFIRQYNYEEVPLTVIKPYTHRAFKRKAVLAKEKQQNPSPDSSIKYDNK